MTGANAFVWEYDEFSDFLAEKTNGTFDIADENGEWFFVKTEDCPITDDQGDYSWLSKEIGVKIKEILVDLCVGKVIFIY